MYLYIYGRREAHHLHTKTFTVQKSMVRLSCGSSAFCRNKEWQQRRRCWGREATTYIYIYIYICICICISNNNNNNNNNNNKKKQNNNDNNNNKNNNNNSNNNNDDDNNDDNDDNNIYSF